MNPEHHNVRPASEVVPLNPEAQSAIPPDGVAAAPPPAASEIWDGITHPRSTMGSGRPLVEVVIDLGFADADRARSCAQTAVESGRRLDVELVESGVITPDQLSRTIAERQGLDHVDLTVFKVDMTCAHIISASKAKQYVAVPVARMSGDVLLVAISEPSNVVALQDITMMTGNTVRPVVASKDDILALVARLTRLDDVVESATLAEEEASGEAEVLELRESPDEAPVIKLVNSVIAQAVEQGASDIHLSPDGTNLRVRFRIDGVLQDITEIPKRMSNGAISRVKIMSDLDISERRRPQDGRVGLKIDKKHIDLRVVTLPSVHGESIVIRILDQDGGVVHKLEALGFSPRDERRFERAISQSYGAVLVTGPTGSGKSTTLYTGVGIVNTPEKNIITIEDPVEFQLDGITQVQVNPRAGLTFAAGLRSMMRADPDIIMVGEIRDRETAQIAVEAALTGHLVLSTLHTNDAPTAITRLVEMGIEPFLVASAIDCVVAQRLARTLCLHCKEPVKISKAVLIDHGFQVDHDIEAFGPVGCQRCGQSGYKGRIGLYEIMMISEEIRDLAIQRASADRIMEVAVNQGMIRLREDGLEKIRAGKTSVTEVARVTGTGGLDSDEPPPAEPEPAPVVDDSEATSTQALPELDR